MPSWRRWFATPGSRYSPRRTLRISLRVRSRSRHAAGRGSKMLKEVYALRKFLQAKAPETFDPATTGRCQARFDDVRH